MQRRSLLGMMAGGVVLSLQSATAQNGPAGKWYLVDVGADEHHIPGHRMDLLFRYDSGAWCGWILSRRDGSEIPLASADFDGSTLRFQMVAASGKTQSEMPIMVMNRAGEVFKGFWTAAGGNPIGPELKLLRARE